MQIHLRKHKSKDQISTAAGTMMTPRNDQRWDQIVAVVSGKEQSSIDGYGHYDFYAVKWSTRGI